MPPPLNDLEIEQRRSYKWNCQPHRPRHPLCRNRAEGCTSHPGDLTSSAPHAGSGLWETPGRHVPAKLQKPAEGRLMLLLKAAGITQNFTSWEMLLVLEGRENQSAMHLKGDIPKKTPQTINARLFGQNGATAPHACLHCSPTLPTC